MLDGLKPLHGCPTKLGTYTRITKVYLCCIDSAIKTVVGRAGNSPGLIADVAVFTSFKVSRKQKSFHVPLHVLARVVKEVKVIRFYRRWSYENVITS